MYHLGLIIIRPVVSVMESKSHLGPDVDETNIAVIKDICETAARLLLYIRKERVIQIC